MRGGRKSTAFSCIDPACGTNGRRRPETHLIAVLVGIYISYRTLQTPIYPFIRLPAPVPYRGDFPARWARPGGRIITDWEIREVRSYDQRKFPHPRMDFVHAQSTWNRFSWCQLYWTLPIRSKTCDLHQAFHHSGSIALLYRAQYGYLFRTSLYDAATIAMLYRDLAR